MGDDAAQGPSWPAAHRTTPKRWRIKPPPHESTASSGNHPSRGNSIAGKVCSAKRAGRLCIRRRSIASRRTENHLAGPYGFREKKSGAARRVRERVRAYFDASHFKVREKNSTPFTGGSAREGQRNSEGIGKRHRQVWVGGRRSCSTRCDAGDGGGAPEWRFGDPSSGCASSMIWR